MSRRAVDFPLRLEPRDYYALHIDERREGKIHDVAARLGIDLAKLRWAVDFLDGPGRTASTRRSTTTTTRYNASGLQNQAYGAKLPPARLARPRAVRRVRLLELGQRLLRAARLIGVPRIQRQLQVRLTP